MIGQNFKLRQNMDFFENSSSGHLCYFNLKNKILKYLFRGGPPCVFPYSFQTGNYSGSIGTCGTNSRMLLVLVGT